MQTFYFICTVLYSFLIKFEHDTSRLKMINFNNTARIIIITFKGQYLNEILLIYLLFIIFYEYRC